MQQNYGTHGTIAAWLITFEQNKYLSVLDELHDDEQEAIEKKNNKINKEMNPIKIQAEN